VEGVSGTDRDLVPHVPDGYPHFTPFIENLEQYKMMYSKSIQDPNSFWAELGEEFYWQRRVSFGLLLFQLLWRTSHPSNQPLARAESHRPD
jgi:hypothetical protein